MYSLENHLAFVNDQLAFHEKRAAAFADTPIRQKRHLATAAKFRELEKYLRQAPAAPISTKKPRRLRLALTSSDIKGIPAELLAELSFGGDKTELAILDAMQDLGGIASLDQILIGIYRKTGDVQKRAQLIQKLYRMAQKGRIHPIPGKKGAYSLEPISEAEAAQLLGELGTDDLLLESAPVGGASAD